MTQQYYSLNRIKEKNAKINLLIGERSNGKSYAVKFDAISKAYSKRSCTFGYLRRYDADIKTQLVEDYFCDMPIDKITNGEFTKIIAWRGSLYFANINDEGKPVKGFCCGKVFALSISERYKSTEYPFITDLIFEEFLTKTTYLYDEVALFMQLLSTIFRRREDCHVYMIGNTVNRICPYITEFGLKNIPKMNVGDLDIYKFTDGDVTTIIAVEYCANSKGGTRTGLFFGKFGKNIESGEWETQSYPHLKYKFAECEELYGITLTKDKTAFNMVLLDLPNDDLTVYVYPCNESKRTYERIITDAPDTNANITPFLNSNNRVEKLYHNLWVTNKYVFSDNLCGEDFNQLIKLFKINPL